MTDDITPLLMMVGTVAMAIVAIVGVSTKSKRQAVQDAREQEKREARQDIAITTVQTQMKNLTQRLDGHMREQNRLFGQLIALLKPELKQD